MTTYNTYTEAKIANPTHDIFYLEGKFGTKEQLINCGKSGIIYKTNPAEHCISLEDFFEAGHKFEAGDKYLAMSGSVMKVGCDISPEDANDREYDVDKKMFVLSAKALNDQAIEDFYDPEFEQVEWKNGDIAYAKDSSHDEIKFIGLSGNNAVAVCECITSDRKVILDKFWVSDLLKEKPETPEQKKEREIEKLADDACELLFGEPINNCRPDLVATVREIIFARYRKLNSHPKY